MNTANKILELLITDKQTGEDWQCCYEATYVESLTKKTGNFKKFDIFIAMLKSGLLKTSNCISLELLTFEDLEALRNHRIRGQSTTYHLSQVNKNRRYLIVQYIVEFDRIQYPLPLEYCGRPDPEILQQHILRLENEVQQLNAQLQRHGRNKSESRIIITLQKQIDELTEDNQELHDEINRLNRLLERRAPANRSRVHMLQNAVRDLEQNVMSQKKSHQHIVQKLINDKISISRELDRIRSSEKVLRDQLCLLNKSRCTRRSPGPSGDSRSPSPRVYRSCENHVLAREMRSRTKHRTKSVVRSDSETSAKLRNVNSSKTVRKEHTSSRSSSVSSKRSAKLDKYHSATGNIATMNASPRRNQSRTSHLDFTRIENRLQALQKMLDSNIL
ncbi:hypothetical protein CBL_04424 [Carabus blaptoides fortunei]